MAEVSNEMLLQAIKELSSNVQEIATSLALHRKETAEKFEQVDKRFEQIDKRFKQVDEKFEQVDKQLHEMNGQIADLNAGQKLFVTEVWNNKKDLQRLKNTLGL